LQKFEYIIILHEQTIYIDKEFSNYNLKNNCL